MSRCLQADSYDSIMTWVWRQVMTGYAQPLSLIIRQAYDETKMHVRVMIDRDLEHSGIDGSKVFVLQSSWAALLKLRRPCTEQWHFMIIAGSTSPHMRAEESTNGLCVASMLQSGPQFLTPRVLEAFSNKVTRIVETDEAKGNMKGERYFQAANPSLRTVTLGVLRTQDPCHSRQAMVGECAFACSFWSHQVPFEPPVKRAHGPVLGGAVG